MRIAAMVVETRSTEKARGWYVAKDEIYGRGNISRSLDSSFEGEIEEQVSFEKAGEYQLN